MENKECNCLKQFIDRYKEKAHDAKSPAIWSAYMTVAKEMEQFIRDMKDKNE